MTGSTIAAGAGETVGSIPGGSVYAKPTLERIGSFRELTQDDDFGFFRWFFQYHRPHCAMTDSSSYTCYLRR